MTTPQYKGSGQPPPTAGNGIGGWLGGFFGGASTPAYKSAPTTPTGPTTPPCVPCPPPPCPPCPPCPVPRPPAPKPTGDGCAQMPVPDTFPIDECTDAVIPIGNGSITIVVQPRA